jgi:hypothetical protein
MTSKAIFNHTNYNIYKLKKLKHTLLYLISRVVVDFDVHTGRQGSGEGGK